MMRGMKWMRENLTSDQQDKVMLEVGICKKFLERETEQIGFDMAFAAGAEDKIGFQIARARFRFHDPRTVGVRVATYIGEPHPIAIITYGPGGCSLWGSVYN